MNLFIYTLLQISISLPVQHMYALLLLWFSLGRRGYPGSAESALREHVV